MTSDSGLTLLIARFGRQYAADQVICQEGEPGSEVFFMVSGQVQVTTAPDLARHHDQQRVLCQLGPGDFFGEMALFDALPRSATVSTLESTQVIVFNQDNLYEQVNLYPELAVRLLKLLAHRMRRMDRQLKEVLGHQDYLLLLNENDSQKPDA